MNQTRLFSLSVFSLFMHLCLIMCMNDLYSAACVMWGLHAEHKHTHQKCIFFI